MKKVKEFLKKIFVKKSRKKVSISAEYFPKSYMKNCFEDIFY